MNRLQSSCLFMGILALASAYKGPRPASWHSHGNSIKNSLRATDLMSPSELESLPSIDEMSFKRLEEMSVQEGANWLNKMYHLSHAGKPMIASFAPKANEIPSYLIAPDNKKVEFKLNELPRIAREGNYLSNEEVTFYINGLPEESEAVNKANHKLVQAYIQRYHSEDIRPRSSKGDDDSSEEIDTNSSEEEEKGSHRMRNPSNSEEREKLNSRKINQSNSEEEKDSQRVRRPSNNGDIEKNSGRKRIPRSQSNSEEEKHSHPMSNPGNSEEVEHSQRMRMPSNSEGTENKFRRIKNTSNRVKNQSSGEEEEKYSHRTNSSGNSEEEQHSQRMPTNSQDRETNSRRTRNPSHRVRNQENSEEEGNNEGEKNFPRRRNPSNSEENVKDSHSIKNPNTQVKGEQAARRMKNPRNSEEDQHMVRNTNNSDKENEDNNKTGPQKSKGSIIVVELGEVIEDMRKFVTLDVERTGMEIAKVLVEVVDKANVPQDSVHIIGSNIGAHVAGAVGRHFIHETGHQLRRITGLDPAKNFLQGNEPLTGLARGDAEFVDVIHTSAYGLGTSVRSGDADFYPGGPSEGVPGAKNVVEASMRAVHYFAESVVPGNEQNFPAVTAHSLIQYMKHQGGKHVYMGINTDDNAEGDFILKVNSNSPFGRRSPANKQQNNHNVHQSSKMHSHEN